MPSSFPPRRRSPYASPYARRPSVSDDDVLEQLRKSLETLRRTSQALEKIAAAFAAGPEVSGAA